MHEDTETLTVRQELELIAMEAWSHELLRPMRGDGPARANELAFWDDIVGRLESMSDSDVARHGELVMVIRSAERA